MKVTFVSVGVGVLYSGPGSLSGKTPEQADPLSSLWRGRRDKLWVDC